MQFGIHSSRKVRVLPLLVLIFTLVCTSQAATEKILHDFNPWQHGFQPNGNLVMDSAGNFYGTTVQGGVSTCNYGAGCGTIFQLTRAADGWHETAIYNFTGGSDGWSPEAVVLDASGNIYGSASVGGAYNGGTVFELSPSANGGWTESTLYTFTQGSDGGQPNLINLGPDGDLYGTTYNGGSGCGVAFELSPSGSGSWAETVLYNFTGGADACHPAGKVVFDSEGNVFGPAGGGMNGVGAVFELTLSEQKWTETLVYSFLSNGSGPNSVVFGTDGSLYGTTDAGTIFELTPHAGTWLLTEMFGLDGSNGADPDGLVFDSAGNLYGVAIQGGTGRCPGGCGTVYEIQISQGIWTLSVIYSFTGGREGATPSPGLVLDGNGNLYGASQEGGSSCFIPGYNCGTVFELSPASGAGWKHNLLFTFPLMDGESPAGLVASGTNTFYGTTRSGGANGAGTVFSLARSTQGGARRTVLYSFGGTPNDGAEPEGELTIDRHGNIYGTTYIGGLYGHGTVFELTPGSNGSWLETVLFSFSGGTDGASPVGGLLLDAAGNLYGTTSLGGTGCERGGCGVVFELVPGANGKWTENLIYSFAGPPDGQAPMAGLTADAAGNLYSTTKSGGVHLEGTVFKLAHGVDGQWAESVLYSLTGHSDGANPRGSVTFDSLGNLYATASAGGLELCVPGPCGTVFELTPADGQWSETTLYGFTGYPNDGANPESGLVFDKAGNLYGTTVAGGMFSGSCFPVGCGTIFELMPNGNWTESIVYAFGYTDGNEPSGQLILDSTGMFFGATSAGGNSDNGIVFAVQP